MNESLTTIDKVFIAALLIWMLSSFVMVACFYVANKEAAAARREFNDMLTNSTHNRP